MLRLNRFVTAVCLGLAFAVPASADVVQDSVDDAVAQMTRNGAQQIKIDKRLNGNTRVMGYTDENQFVIIVDKKTGARVTDMVRPRPPQGQPHWSQQGPDFGDIGGR
ncbi:hypothetical protein BXY66_0794 [Shimia isoporae]|uniref:YpeB-like protein with protease inhibitory function n=2 Tax=Shimia isoporae TaxID=647720 RepID=A0A4R1NKC0_9RHOB|nr:hypothetical protein BXY66_0794 [Shimia isoporae]